mgnify:CR=1 FL=1
MTGIGFTMSLFVGNLAFANNMEYIDGVKIGVLAGSLLSTLFGYFLLLIFSKKWGSNNSYEILIFVDQIGLLVVIEVKFAKFCQCCSWLTVKPSKKIGLLITFFCWANFEPQMILKRFLTFCKIEPRILIKLILNKKECIATFDRFILQKCTCSFFALKNMKTLLYLHQT